MPEPLQPQRLVPMTEFPSRLKVYRRFEPRWSSIGAMLWETEADIVRFPTAAVAERVEDLEGVCDIMAAQLRQPRRPREPRPQAAQAAQEAQAVRASQGNPTNSGGPGSPQHVDSSLKHTCNQR